MMYDAEFIHVCKYLAEECGCPEERVQELVALLGVKNTLKLMDDLNIHMEGDMFVSNDVGFNPEFWHKSKITILIDYLAENAYYVRNSLRHRGSPEPVHADGV